MRIEYSGVDPSVRSLSADPRSVPSKLDEERLREIAGVEKRAAAAETSARVTVSEAGRAMLEAERALQELRRPASTGDGN